MTLAWRLEAGWAAPKFPKHQMCDTALYVYRWRCLTFTAHQNVQCFNPQGPWQTGKWGQQKPHEVTQKVQQLVLSASDYLGFPYEKWHGFNRGAWAGTCFWSLWPGHASGEARALLKTSPGLQRPWIQTRNVLLPLRVFELLNCWRIKGNITNCFSDTFTKPTRNNFISFERTWWNWSKICK